MKSRTVRSVILVATVLLTGLALLPGAAHAGKAANAADPMPLPKAKAILADVQARLRDKRATFDDFRAVLHELTDAHARVGTEAQAKFRREAEAQMLKAFMLFKKDRKGANQRRDVNELAAEQLALMAKVLGAKESKALSLKLRKHFKTIAGRWKPEAWHADPLEAGFAALAALNHHDTLLWLTDEYARPNERMLVFAVAALKAMPSFRDVTGRVRREMCDTLRVRFESTESTAARLSNTPADTSAKRIWDQLRTYVIPAMQHFAGRPANAKGEALSSVAELSDWLRDHKKASDPVWKASV